MFLGEKAAVRYSGINNYNGHHKKQQCSEPKPIAFCRSFNLSLSGQSLTINPHAVQSYGPAACLNWVQMWLMTARFRWDDVSRFFPPLTESWA